MREGVEGERYELGMREGVEEERYELGGREWRGRYEGGSGGGEV